MFNGRTVPQFRGRLQRSLRPGSAPEVPPSGVGSRGPSVRGSAPEVPPSGGQLQRSLRPGVDSRGPSVRGSTPESLRPGSAPEVPPSGGRLQRSLRSKTTLFCLDGAPRVPKQPVSIFRSPCQRHHQRTLRPKVGSRGPSVRGSAPEVPPSEGWLQKSHRPGVGSRGPPSGVGS